MENNLTKKKLRDFSLFIGFGLPFFIGWLIPFIFDHEPRLWTLWIGLTFLIIGLFKPYLLFYPYKFWMKLGLILGWINSRFILSLVFILIVLPISFFMRIFKYDPLRIKLKKVNSYREIRKINKIDLTKIF